MHVLTDTDGVPLMVDKTRLLADLYPTVNIPLDGGHAGGGMMVANTFLLLVAVPR